MRPIDADFCKELGATCIAGRNKNGDLVAIATLDSIPTGEVSILDKVRAEIKALQKTYPFMNHIDTYVKEDDVMEIIDKYKAESED